MAPTAFWAALAVGLQFWAAGRAVPAQAVFTPYIPEPGSSCRQQEFYNQKIQMCCSKCPPGYRVRSLCNTTSDTVCASCESSTYTQLWNLVTACFSCNSRCSSDQVESQACTTKQNRICTCKPGWYCTLGRQEGCRLCAALRKCGPGFGVAKPGTATTNVMCAPCGPGTFSDTMSSTDTCRPHRNCSSVSIPGTASTDAVCTSVLPTRGPATTRSQHMEPTPGPSTAPSTFFLLPKVPSPPSFPVEQPNTGSISLPIGLIVGVTALGLLLIVVVNCVIMTQKKKKPFCLQGDAKVPHLPANKAQGAPGPEQQHLLTTGAKLQQQLLGELNQHHRQGGAHQMPDAGTRRGEGWHVGGGSDQLRQLSRGIFWWPRDPGQRHLHCQCLQQPRSQLAVPFPGQLHKGHRPQHPQLPEEEQVPFSKEERPFQSHQGAPETLLQGLEEKPLPLGVPDAGMKPS